MSVPTLLRSRPCHAHPSPFPLTRRSHPSSLVWSVFMVSVITTSWACAVRRDTAGHDCSIPHTRLLRPWLRGSSRLQESDCEVAVLNQARPDQLLQGDMCGANPRGVDIPYAPHCRQTTSQLRHIQPQSDTWRPGLGLRNRPPGELEFAAVAYPSVALNSALRRDPFASPSATPSPITCVADRRCSIVISFMHRQS